METREVHVLLLPCPQPCPTVSLSSFKQFPASDFQFYNFSNGRGFCTWEEADVIKKKRRQRRRKRSVSWPKKRQRRSEAALASHNWNHHEAAVSE